MSKSKLIFTLFLLSIALIPAYYLAVNLWRYILTDFETQRAKLEREKDDFYDTANKVRGVLNHEQRTHFK